MVKFAISTKLFELGYSPYIIGAFYDKHSDISFIRNHTNLVIVNNFSEIKKKKYDILMVNSDQTWRKKYLNIYYDFAFLCFAKNWNIYKFIYGASLGSSKWKLNKKDEEIAKKCLKTVKNISVREIGAVKRIQIHLGLKVKFVLDPTLLLDVKYYLNLINDYKDIYYANKSYILTYLFSEEKEILEFIKNSAIKLNYTIFRVKQYHKNSIKKFLYGIYNCRAVITNSYHATIFSIIFKKPFISFIYENSNNDRFDSLKEIFKINKRIIKYNNIPNINLLQAPLNIDEHLMNSLKIKSINYLKENLRHFKNHNNFF